MAGTVVVDNITTGTGATVPAATVVSGTAKAWVNFNGTGTVAIRGSFNVSSITDNGTGDYTVNFTNAIADANYSSAITSSDNNGGTANMVCNTVDYVTPRTTTALRMWTRYGLSNVQYDCNVVCVTIFR